VIFEKIIFGLRYIDHRRRKFENLDYLFNGEYAVQSKFTLAQVGSLLSSRLTLQVVRYFLALSAPESDDKFAVQIFLSYNVTMYHDGKRPKFYTITVHTNKKKNTSS